MSSIFKIEGDEGDGDEAFKKIADIERKSFEISQKFIEIQNQVWDIENGHLPREHHLHTSAQRSRKEVYNVLRILDEDLGNTGWH